MLSSLAIPKLRIPPVWRYAGSVLQAYWPGAPGIPAT